ncbi:MAG: serine/threonine protein kinase [Gemmatimonadales bacterium]|nr:serine/threonine protein kinase [Gemmatimonadales bacterium]
MARLLAPLPPNTPAGGADSHGGTSAVPEDLLREASQRLGIISLMAAVLWVVGTSLDHLVLLAFDPTNPVWRRLGFSDAVGVVNVAVGLGLFAFTRRSRREPQFLLNLGLGYMIFVCLSLGIIGHWGPVVGEWNPRPIFTWGGIVVVMFAAIVPHPPKTTLIAGLIAASMTPLGMLLARANGTLDFSPTGLVILMHYPDYILVGVATVISGVVMRLGRHVTKAREMGSYHLGELLDQGGMGAVYRATHRMLARPAAIKVIRPELLASNRRDAVQLAVKRFHREAEAAASLRSPHTVAVYDFGVTEDGALYFVMELLEGMTLEDIVREDGPMPAGRVVHLLTQVCESLEEAHARGMVHRDIKPANIHVGRLGLRSDFVKVLDFGLVKAVEGRRKDGAATVATEDGITPGTPDYMAPEMTLGDTVDGRVDIYAVGCVAHFLLTGKAVFEAANVFHMIARHLNDAPVPVSAVAKGPVPRALEELILRCLAKQPADRPQSAAELSRALREAGAEVWGEGEARAWWAAHEVHSERPGLPPAILAIRPIQ